MNLTEIIYIAFAYLLGAIPTGYLITRATMHKNILEIGWRKTSGSNVFKNVGKWQGIVTAVLDVLKGFSAVGLARFFGFSDSVQVFAGLSALVGNNWSVFIKFSGGRGLAVLAGAIMVFSWKLFIVALMPVIISALIWTASIGTFIAFGAVIFFSFYFHSFSTAGIFMIVSLVPIFLKRLSPIKELTFKRKDVIWNRLIFDDDVPNREWRIKKIVEKLKKH